MNVKDRERKKRGGLAVRRANYTHRRKGVFNGESIVDSQFAGNVRYRTKMKFCCQTDTKKCQTITIYREAPTPLWRAVYCAKIGRPLTVNKQALASLSFLPVLSAGTP